MFCNNDSDSAIAVYCNEVGKKILETMWLASGGTFVIWRFSKYLV